MASERAGPSVPDVRTSNRTAALAADAAAALFTAPDLPDTGSLRDDLLACGRAYL